MNISRGETKRRYGVREVGRYLQACDPRRHPRKASEGVWAVLNTRRQFEGARLETKEMKGPEFDVHIDVPRVVNE